MTVELTEKKSKFSPVLKEHFNNLNVQFGLYPLSDDKSYKSLHAFYDFVKKQQLYWENCKVGKANEIKAHFTSIANSLDQAVKYQENNFNHSIGQLQQAISLIKYNRFPCVFPSPLADYVKEQYMIHPERADVVCIYLLNAGGNKQINITWSNPNHFEGVIEAFFYKHPNLQNRVFKSLDTSFESLKTRYVDALNNVDQEYFEKLVNIKQSNSSVINDIEAWKENITTSTDNFLNEKNEELLEVVRLYKEQLKLEEPAKYWDETSKEYERKGKMWVWISVVTTAIFILILSVILFKLPTPPMILDFTSIKMTIVLTVIISAGLFLINLFIRLATSAFHLSTDAK